jgi:hypothetical protein
LNVEAEVPTEILEPLKIEHRTVRPGLHRQRGALAFSNDDGADLAAFGGLLNESGELSCASYTLTVELYDDVAPPNTTRVSRAVVRNFFDHSPHRRAELPALHVGLFDIADRYSETNSAAEHGGDWRLSPLDGDSLSVRAGGPWNDGRDGRGAEERDGARGCPGSSHIESL